MQHLAVPFIDHMLAHSIQGVKCLAAIIAPKADVVVCHLLPQVIEQALNICAVFGVGNEKRMGDGHVLEVLYQILTLVSTEQTVAFSQRIFGNLVPLIGIHLKEN